MSSRSAASAGGWPTTPTADFVALGGLLNGAVFLSIYPHIHNNDLILFMGSLESIGAALSAPSISSLMSQGAVHREFSVDARASTRRPTRRRSPSAAGTSGFLFTINPALPFTVVAMLSAALGLTTLWWWRNVHRQHHRDDLSDGGGFAATSLRVRTI